MMILNFLRWVEESQSCVGYQVFEVVSISCMIAGTLIVNKRGLKDPMIFDGVLSYTISAVVQQ